MSLLIANLFRNNDLNNLAARAAQLADSELRTIPLSPNSPIETTSQYDKREKVISIGKQLTSQMEPEIIQYSTQATAVHNGLDFRTSLAETLARGIYSPDDPAWGWIRQWEEGVYTHCYRFTTEFLSLNTLAADTFLAGQTVATTLYADIITIRSTIARWFSLPEKMHTNAKRQDYLDEVDLLLTNIRNSGGAGNASGICDAELVTRISELSAAVAADGKGFVVAKQYEEYRRIHGPFAPSSMDYTTRYSLLPKPSVKE